MRILMNCKILGEGHPLILLHGLYGMSENWLPIAKILSANYRIFLPDWRNHGLSQHTETHTYQNLTDDLKYFAEFHSLERFILLGHSMGGKAAMRFALENPEMISSLIVVDIAPVDYNRKSNSSSILQHRMILDALFSLDLNSIKSRTEAENQLLTKISDKRTVKFLLKNLSRNTGQFQWRLNIPVLRQYIEEIGSGLNPIDFNPATSYPVLFIKGEKSDYISANEIPEIRRFFPFAKIVSISNASHWVHADNPTEFIQTVRNFLD